MIPDLRDAADYAQAVRNREQCSISLTLMPNGIKIFVENGYRITSTVAYEDARIIKSQIDKCVAKLKGGG